MKLLFVGKDDQHLGTLELGSVEDTIVVKKFKSQFKVEVLDTPEEDDHDEDEREEKVPKKQKRPMGMF